MENTNLKGMKIKTYTRFPIHRVDNSPMTYVQQVKPNMSDVGVTNSIYTSRIIPDEIVQIAVKMPSATTLRK